MPSLNVTQKSAIVYFNAPEGVDLCGQEGTVVALTANPDIPEFVGTPLSAIPTQEQLLGVVLQGQPTREPASPRSSACMPGLIKAALSDTPGTINAGTPVTITANGTWKAAASGDTVYARVIHAQWEQGLVEIGFVPSYQVAAA